MWLQGSSSQCEHSVNTLSVVVMWLQGSSSQCEHSVNTLSVVMWLQGSSSQSEHSAADSTTAGLTTEDVDDSCTQWTAY